jgi:dolichol-phosphate mannosyltransferase
MHNKTEVANHLPAISVVVPAYKEERNIRDFLARMEASLSKIDESYEILFCVDPSPDRTEEVILSEINRNPRIKLVVFSRRFGQPAATMAGICLCKGQSCLVIDVDLQDPPELALPMYEKLREGYDVVYAKRRSRKGETLLKRIVVSVGYRLINKLSEIRIPTDTGDFRLMTRRVVDELRSLNETHGFLRGMVAYVGFRQTYVEYDRDPRAHGSGKYHRHFGSWKINLDAIVGFSNRPLRLMSIAGALLTGFSFLMGLWTALQHFLGMNLTPGLSITVLVLTFFSGVQLLSLGLMGEYIGRIYDEVKRRPMYIIDHKVNL